MKFLVLWHFELNRLGPEVVRAVIFASEKIPLPALIAAIGAAIRRASLRDLPCFRHRVKRRVVFKLAQQWQVYCRYSPGTGAEE